MYFSRDIQKKINKNLVSDYILILIGARQTGKTTLLKHIRQELKSKGEKTFFYNLEDYDYLQMFNTSPKNILELLPLKNQKDKLYIFIDEIQYLSNPTNFLKYLYDEYKNRIKLIVSGSSAFYFDKKFKDSLAGRKRLYWLKTLNYHEFLIFNKEDELVQQIDNSNFISKKSFPTPLKRKVERYWNQFIQFGGFPRVALANEVEEKIEVLNDLTGSFIKKDIMESGIKEPEKFYNLLKILSSQIGNLVNKNKLSNMLNISINAIENYLSIMQKNFHISLIIPFYSNIQKELRKMPKIFFHDTGFRNALINNYENLNFRTDSGSLFENVIYISLTNHYYRDSVKFWRTQDGREVDFIVDGSMAIEVKKNIAQFKISKYKKFLEEYDLPFKLIYKEGELGRVNKDQFSNRIEFINYLQIL